MVLGMVFGRFMVNRVVYIDADTDMDIHPVESLGSDLEPSLVPNGAQSHPKPSKMEPKAIPKPSKIDQKSEAKRQDVF